MIMVSFTADHRRSSIGSPKRDSSAASIVMENFGIPNPLDVKEDVVHNECIRKLNSMRYMRIQ